MSMEQIDFSRDSSRVQNCENWNPSLPSYSTSRLVVLLIRHSTTAQNQVVYSALKLALNGFFHSLSSEPAILDVVFSADEQITISSNLEVAVGHNIDTPHQLLQTTFVNGWYFREQMVTGVRPTLQSSNSWKDAAMKN